MLWAVVIAFVVSGLASYFLLNRQREAFARRVDERAQRVSSRFEEMKAKEDATEVPSRPCAQSRRRLSWRRIRSSGWPSTFARSCTRIFQATTAATTRTSDDQETHAASVRRRPQPAARAASAGDRDQQAGVDAERP